MASFWWGKFPIAIGVTPFSVFEARWCGNIEMEDSRENDKTDIGEKSQIIDESVFAFAFNPDANLLGYPRYTAYWAITPAPLEGEKWSLPAKRMHI